VWWRELLLVGATYGTYTLTRNTLPSQPSRARSNALDLYHAEQHLHVDLERRLNDLLAQAGGPLSVLANYAYSLAHLAVTLAVLVWLYVARPRAYLVARRALLSTTLLALLVFWAYPLAPPRFFPHLGFVDTVVRDGTWGSWGSTAVTSISNQYAAMPSLHMAWSLWCAGALVLWARPLWLRLTAPLYPVLVFLVIVGTANHWTLDALGGLAVVGLGTAVAVLLGRWRYMRWAIGSRNR
jgi:hypothetical protein